MRSPGSFLSASDPGNHSPEVPPCILPRFLVNQTNLYRIIPRGSLVPNTLTQLDYSKRGSYIVVQYVSKLPSSFELAEHVPKLMLGCCKTQKDSRGTQVYTSHYCSTCIYLLNLALAPLTLRKQRSLAVAAEYPCESPQ